MISRISPILLCMTVPAALGAQQVDLRSPDEFISVEGEITGFNGVMLRVQTTVGPVSVPASEVICYGEGCLSILANNDFGLTEADLQGVVAVSADAAAPAAPAPASGDQTLDIAFAAPAYRALFDQLAASYDSAQAGEGGAVVLDSGVTLTPADDLSAADIAVRAVPLDGEAPQAFDGPSGWSVPGASLSHQMVGLNAFTVLIAPSAGIDSITTADLARVFAGQVTNWSQIGGADMAILPLRLPAESPVQQELEAVVMAPNGLTFANSVLTMGDEAGIAASVNQFPGSVSVVTSDKAIAELAVPVVGTCGIAVAATPFNIVSGDYPLVRPVMAVYGGSAPAAVGFFDFAATDAAEALVAAQGLVDFSATRQDSQTKNARVGGLMGATLDDAQRAAAGQMFQVLFSAERLSTTFYGGAVSGPEAAWNRAMMVDLLEVLAAPENAGKEVAFVGTAVSENGSEDAISRSATAATELRDAIAAAAGSQIAAAGLTLSSYGFGDVAPVTCIDNQVGGPAQTRIEVWLR